MTGRNDEKRLLEVDRRLREEYGTRPLGNKPDPLDELIFIQLSIRTREEAYQGGYAALKRLLGGDWGRIPEVPEKELSAMIAGGGMARVKARRLRQQIASIRERFGEVSLEPLRSMTDEEAEAFLIGLPGVGPKAARCVMLYSLGRDVFPVDSHCRRVLGRLDFRPAGLDRKTDHDLLQDLVPPPIRGSLHINLIHHGRTRCLPTRPRCDDCPIGHLCPGNEADRRIAAELFPAVVIS